MIPKEIIPIKKEFIFILKIFLIMIISLGISLLVLFIFLNKEIGNSYLSAFRITWETYQKLNFFIITAIFTQLLFSSILLYIVALLYSHKIAGPIFRLKLILKKYMQGEETEKIVFRRTDFLAGVSKWFNDFFSFREKQKTLIAEAERLQSRLETNNEKEKKDITERIKSLIAELEKGNDT